VKEHPVEAEAAVQRFSNVLGIYFANCERWRWFAPFLLLQCIYVL